MADPTTAPELETAPAAEPTADEAVVAEVLVEEVSIDGMCGVY
jgi:mycofactocin precursor